jgi:hypothetical protein
MGDRLQTGGAMERRAWAALRLLVLLALGAMAATASRAQPSDATRAAFRDCDAKAVLALNIARNYMMGGRNKELVEPYVKDSALGRAMADDIIWRVDAGQLRHPGEVAAEVLFQCAAEQKINVGASRQQVALCFTRTDIAFFLYYERSQHVIRQTAVTKVQQRLRSRELYPAALFNQVADAVYAQPELPELQQLMRAVAWTCINQASAKKAAPAASG